MSGIKTIVTAIKPYLPWFIWGCIFFFMIQTCKNHWQEVTRVRINSQGWLILITACVVTLLAHIWSAWVWTWILKLFQQPSNPRWAIPVYLTTNIAKYLPGNIWHYYGRINAVYQGGGSLGAASLSVLLEPLLMAAAALIIALGSSGLGVITTHWQTQTILPLAGLSVVLVGIHPRILNPLLDRLSQLKGKMKDSQTFTLISYPWLPLVGEFGFVIWRGTGFLFTVMALQSVTWTQIPQLISAFSFAWLLGLIVPGAPGGLGIFEATIIAILDREAFPVGNVLTTVALYRVISILAELIAAGIAWGNQKKFLH
jgi:uncharacterized membrane protein YbhN (UPF0104 family)